MATMGISKQKNVVDMWTPPFGVRIPICDVNICQHQNNENYAIACAL